MNFICSNRLAVVSQVYASARTSTAIFIAGTNLYVAIYITSISFLLLFTEYSEILARLEESIVVRIGNIVFAILFVFD